MGCFCFKYYEVKEKWFLTASTQELIGNLHCDLWTQQVKIHELAIFESETFPLLASVIQEKHKILQINDYQIFFFLDFRKKRKIVNGNQERNLILLLKYSWFKISIWLLQNYYPDTKTLRIWFMIKAPRQML